LRNWGRVPEGLLSKLWSGLGLLASSVTLLFYFKKYSCLKMALGSFVLALKPQL